MASAHTNNHAAPTPLLPRTALRAPNSTSDGCLPRFKRRHNYHRHLIWVHDCAHTRASGCTNTYLYDQQSHGLLPRAQFCEPLNWTSPVASRNSSTNITNASDLRCSSACVRAITGMRADHGRGARSRGADVTASAVRTRPDCPWQLRVAAVSTASPCYCHGSSR